MVKYTENLIPKMTNDESNGIKLTCSAFYTSQEGRGERRPFRALDNNLDEGGWEYQNQSPPKGGHWFKIHFKNKPRMVSKITLANSPIVCSIKNFKIQGSNDDINYKDLYTGKHPYGELDTTKAEYEFNNNTNYYYYKIIVIDSYSRNPTTYGGIGELEMYEKIVKFLLKQNNQYYTIKPEYYSDGKFQPLTLKGGEQPNEIDYENFGFDDMNDLLIPIQVGEETFKPYDKLENEFEICMAMDKE